MTAKLYAVAGMLDVVIAAFNGGALAARFVKGAKITSQMFIVNVM